MILWGEGWVNILLWRRSSLPSHLWLEISICSGLALKQESENLCNRPDSKYSRLPGHAVALDSPVLCWESSHKQYINRLIYSTWMSVAVFPQNFIKAGGRLDLAHELHCAKARSASQMNGEAQAQTVSASVASAPMCPSFPFPTPCFWWASAPYHASDAALGSDHRFVNPVDTCHFLSMSRCAFSSLHPCCVLPSLSLKNFSPPLF